MMPLWGRVEESLNRLLLVVFCSFCWASAFASAPDSAAKPTPSPTVTGSVPAKGEATVTPYGHWTTQFAARINPVGLRLSNLGGWRIPLSASDHILLKGTYLEFGGGMPITPVSLFPTAYIEVVPLAPIVLRAQVKQMTFLGALGNVAAFTQGEVDSAQGGEGYWSPAVIEARRDEGEGIFATGWDHMLSGTLQLKFGRFVAKGTFEYHWVNLNLPGEKIRWYDSTDDLIFEPRDSKILGKGLLAYLAQGELSGDRFLLLGTTFDYQKAIALGMSRQAAGVLVVWRPGLWARRKLTFGTLIQHYVQDAGDHRTGQFTVAAFTQVSFGGPPRKKGAQ